MELTWFGHTCFRLRAREAVVVTDPYGTGAGYPPLRLAADIVTVSHASPLIQPAVVTGARGDTKAPRVLSRPGEYEVASVPIVGVQTYRDREKGARLGKNVAFVMTLEGFVIGHLGAIGHLPNAEQAEALSNLDVLLLPIGGEDALDAKLAVETISLLQPRLVVPMRYRPASGGADALARFLRELGASPGEPQPKLTLSRSALSDTTAVVLLAPPAESAPRGRAKEET
ncbi:MAG: MBL fold metallo-hydrolase [Chloroflexi bacterium]|nr:MBL fold metallo-hydrolase [Chloroflexota bacterium]